MIKSILKFILRLSLCLGVAFGILHMGACMGGSVTSGGAGAGPMAGPGAGPGDLSGQNNAANPAGNAAGDGNFVPPSPTGVPAADPTPVGMPGGVSFALTVLCNDNINGRQLLQIEGALYDNNQGCWQNCCSNHEVQIRVDSENFSQQTPASTVNGLQGYFIFNNLNLPKNAAIDFYFYSSSKGGWWPLSSTNGNFCGGGPPNLPGSGNPPTTPGNCDLGSPGGGTQT